MLWAKDLIYSSNCSMANSSEPQTKGEHPMDNPAIIRKNIRFQRAAVANTLAILATIQQRGGELLNITLEQTSWLPGKSRQACLYWNQAWTTHLGNMTGTIDRGFADHNNHHQYAGDHERCWKLAER